ncbi:ABC-type transport auxiliary lipoprotein family protein [Massilia luteola]|uniref:ABC-type transport auxiliary lipoprotein family protein n=1 Tax=Massilia luteola TaxID=3081751 RepID=UPI002ACBF92F|nr:ABC-type transport auxiliary lipoprotein family protein [Massilia sp. Gc5]
MHPTRFLLAAALALILSGCASQKGQPTTQFDFGPATPASAQAPAQGTLGPVVVTDVTGSSALDNERMFYRLSYADPLQARTYANSRWTANPLQLLTQRFKTRLAQAGARVLSETDASIGIPLLRIDVDEFIQDFGGVSRSTGVVAVRASVFQGHTLVDQRSFRQSGPATSADAAGGARALAASTDAVAADIVAWLGTLNIDRR